MLIRITLVTLFLLVNQSIGEVCRTCSGTCSGAVPQVNCNRNLPPALPFGFQSTSENDVDMQQYGCLNLEYSSGNDRVKVEQCINVNDYQSFCFAAKSVVSVITCNISVNNQKLQSRLNKQIITGDSDDDTLTDNSTTDNSTTDNSTTENSTTDNSTTDNSTTDNSTTDNSTTDNSTTDNSTTDNSTTDNGSSSTTSSTTTSSTTTSSTTTSSTTTSSTTTSKPSTGKPGGASTIFLSSALLIGTVALLAA